MPLESGDLAPLESGDLSEISYLVTKLFACNTSNLAFKRICEGGHRGDPGRLTSKFL